MSGNIPIFNGYVLDRVMAIIKAQNSKEKAQAVYQGCLCVASRISGSPNPSPGPPPVFAP